MEEHSAQNKSALPTELAGLGVRIGAGLHALAQMTLPFLARFTYYDAVATFYESSGWLPYRTAPFQVQFLKHPRDRDEAHSRLRDYYARSSSEILRDIETRTEGYDIDTEAVAVMREATQAHRERLYRCVYRVLLPEMERVIRADLLQIEKLIPINKKRIRAGLQQQHLEDVVIDFPHDLILFRILHKHLFVPVRETSLTDASVPNRHAGTHGWLAYSTMKEALNAIICADYVFRLLSSLKNPNSPET